MIDTKLKLGQKHQERGLRCIFIQFILADRRVADNNSFKRIIHCSMIILNGVIPPQQIDT